MLCRLNIRNYAIIDQLEVDFSEKLNVITGETGAGKSIILGALGLILGERAEGSILIDKEKKCVVEGCFAGPFPKAVAKFLQTHELDEQDDLTVRREITPSGKSRAFVNDTPVNLNQLNELSSMLVDLHQQFDTLELGDIDFQRQVLDALAKQQALVAEYQSQYSRLKKAEGALQQLELRKLEFSREADYNQFQFDELAEAALKEDELEELEAQIAVQSGAEEIKTALERISYELDEQDEPLVRKLKSLGAGLQPYAGIREDIAQIIGRIESAAIELKDLASEAAHLASAVHGDPAELARLNDRMVLGYKLLKKHGVKTTAELLEIQSLLEAKLQSVLDIDDQIIQAKQAVANYQLKVVELSQKITKGRQSKIPFLEKSVNEMLARIGMPNARIMVDFRPVDPGPSGADQVNFLFDANKSGQFAPLRKVASGGELSRLMLAIKSLVASSMQLPTLIFDEVDTGISGEAARQVGIIMKELASSMQVICITHQPQIAGKADAHYFVYKAVNKDRITTGVRVLNTEERIEAIARMLSGEKPTAAAVANAREMIESWLNP